MSEITDWLEERQIVYKLAYESAVEHFKDREYTPQEFAKYQETYVKAYYKEPRRPLRRWND